MNNQKDIALSIIIPAYKEADNLSVLLPKLVNTLSNLKISFEVLVIDTMTKIDDTAEIAKTNGVIYINRQNGNYYGDAVRTGILLAKGEKLIFMDADGSHSPDYIKNFYDNAKDYDLVIGSRYIKNGKTENNIILIFMSLIVNIIYRIFLGLKIKDVSNSFRLYDSQMLKKISLTCNNFDIVEEVLIKLLKKYPKMTIKEIPIEFKKRLHGKSKRDLVKFVFSYISTIFKLIKIKKAQG